MLIRVIQQVLSNILISGDCNCISCMSGMYVIVCVVCVCLCLCLQGSPLSDGLTCTNMLICVGLFTIIYVRIVLISLKRCWLL